MRAISAMRFRPWPSSFRENFRLSVVSTTLIINEIYLSLQGESTFAGLPCIFIRLTACNLRCSYCDTAYAFTEGKKQSLEEVLAEVNRLAAPFRQNDDVGDDVADDVRRRTHLAAPP